MKQPGFSTARERPLREGSLTKVASVIEALSLKSPAGITTVEVAEVAAVLSVSYSYLPFNDALISLSNSPPVKMKRGCLRENSNNNRVR